MRLSRILILSWACVGTLSMLAQDNFSKSFADFKKGLFDKYNGFRSEVLDNYDNFLEGVWVEYQGNQAEHSNLKPKPKRAPISPSGQQVDESVPPQDDIINARQFINETAGNNDSIELKESAIGKFVINFYGLPVEIERFKVNIADRLSSTVDYALQWRELEKIDTDKDINAALTSIAEVMGLNDYLKFELVNAFVNQYFADKDITSRMSMSHYLLTNMGYDVRIGLSGSKNPVLLVPFKQNVYARPFMVIDNSRYYIFADEKVDFTKAENLKIATCELPKSDNRDNFLELKLEGLNLPYTPYEFNITHGDLTINGEINLNFFPVLYHYPQMPTSDFALSTVSSETRDAIVTQLKEQLEGIDEIEAVNRLLHFTQNFDYAIDEEFHGFEKPYFFEEMLYYPKNDCEDRAIFYTYLLWNVLGIENQLLYYPGHESVGVKIKNPLKGDSYFSGGKRFFISDPTYIGAPTGESMPEYVHETPKVDYHYK